MSHLQSVKNNQQRFAEIGGKYDSMPGIQVLTSLFARSILEFDPEKGPIPSSEVTVPSSNDHSGVQLPDPATWSSRIIKRDTKLMDFASGTGLVAQKLAPYMPDGTVVGIDISDEMLRRFEEKAEVLKQSYPNFSMKAVVGDITADSFDTAEWKDYADVLICTLAFHHLHDYDKICQIFKSFVKPGGWVLIYDFYNPDDEKLSKVSTEVSHIGLTVEGMNASLADQCDNVASAHVARVRLLQEPNFIEHHCTKAIVADLKADKLEKVGNLYVVDCDIILGAGRKK